MFKSRHLPPRQTGICDLGQISVQCVHSCYLPWVPFSPVLLSWCLLVFHQRLTSLDAMPHQRGLVRNLAISVASAGQYEQDEEYDQNHCTYDHQTVCDHPHHRFPKRHAACAVWRYALSWERPCNLCKWYTAIFCLKDRRGIFKKNPNKDSCTLDHSNENYLRATSQAVFRGHLNS